MSSTKVSHRSVRSKTVKSQADLVETIQDTNVDLERRVIYLFDDIDSKSAKMTIQSLDFLNKTDGLVYLHISTPGGVWVDGMAVFSAIRLSRNNVVGIIYGDCSSMGSVILQACKTRIATTECEMLIHPGTSSGTADSISFVNRGKHEEKILDKMYRIYWDRIPAEKKMKLSYEKFKKMFSHDIFLDSDQALKYGLVDEVR